MKTNQEKILEIIENALVVISNHKSSISIIEKRDRVYADIEIIFRKEKEQALKTQAQEILKKVEFRIVVPYEGILQSEHQCCIEQHRRITDNLREWFEKLKYELK